MSGISSRYIRLTKVKMHSLVALLGENLKSVDSIGVIVKNNVVHSVVVNFLQKKTYKEFVI